MRLSRVLLVDGTREPEEGSKGPTAGVGPDSVGQPPAKVFGRFGFQYTPERPVEVPLTWRRLDAYSG